MPTHFAPKPTKLQGEPTPNELESWINNLMFNLTVDGNFEEFLTEGFKWSPSSVVNRGLLDDESEEPARRTARQKVAYLDLMLGSISAYAPVISKRFITQEAQSLDEIWDRLRTRFGCRKTGSLILELAALTTEPDETHEALWERVLSFIEGNLILSSDKITHQGVEVSRSEVMTPTLLNICIVLWLKIIHPSLPALVKQKYATELRSKTLASIRDEVSESLNSLLYELSGNENAAVSRSYNYNNKPYNSRYQRKQYNPSKKGQQKSCIVCLTGKRPAQHYLSECPFLPDEDKQYMKSRTRLVDVEEEDIHTDEEEEESNNRRVGIESSPELLCRCEGEQINAVLDTGAMSNLIAERCAKRVNAKILHTRQTASQAAGDDLNVVGEVHMEFERYPHKFKFNGLVVRNLKDEVVAGVPFLDLNDIWVRTSKKLIYIGDKEIIKYDTVRSSHSANRSVAVILRVPNQTALLPGDSVNFAVPPELHGESQVAVEPRMISASMITEKENHMWLRPQIVSTHKNQIELVNTSDHPVLLKKHEQVANIRFITTTEELGMPQKVSECTDTSVNLVNIKEPTLSTAYSNVEVDPGNCHSKTIKQQFHNLHYKYQEVFDDSTLGLYNGHSGKLDVKVNMGPAMPPQRKGRMPLYNRKLQEEYQAVCESLEGTVLVKPEDAGVCVEYLNPSFLVRKPSGKKRLVTAFGEVGKYAKPQPALMSDTNQVLRAIGNWKYIGKADLTSAYWQMPLSRDSMKYCGIVTPYKGIRVYARGAMGMPGTETALEEMLSRVLGDLIASGGVVKIADDLLFGGSSPEAVLEIWENVLKALQINGLKLSASKTICLPQSVTVLGWIWSNGTIKASPHRISALEVVEPPPTVGKLRSFIGSYKFLSKVIPFYSDVLSPLEDTIAGKEKLEKIHWSDSLLTSFKLSQKQLANAKVITIPRTDDHLQVVTDASKTGMAATLFVVRNNKPLVAGFFNAKLRKHQVQWLPCELEALCIGAAVKHFGAEIVNSNHKALVLTDSRPCVQSYEKLCRGEFSSSSRVATFLSIVSRFHVQLAHISGSDNVLVDYASRNPLECNNPDCQICKFIQQLEESVVRQCTVNDVLESGGKVPFSSRNAWLEMQQSCASLRRTAAHLRQGTTPSKKETKIKDVKRYMQIVKVSKDGLLVIYRQEPFHTASEKIVVPRMYLHGLLVALHLKLQHPSKLQLKKVFNRIFYALDADRAISDVSDSCHTCVSLQKMPNTYLEQSTTAPAFIGSHFGADVLKRANQNILVVRENVSSFTTTKFIANEQANTLKEGLLILCSQLCSYSGPPVCIRVDPAPGWRSLVMSKVLEKLGIQLEMGSEKNKNKNAIADRAISELHAEINRIDPNGGEITEVTLAKAVCNLNDRVRNNALSAREIWTKRDQFTGKQLPIIDEKIVKKKYEDRMKSHKASAKYQARGKTQARYPAVSVGDLVYINSDRSKLQPREKYIVVQPKEEITIPNTVCVQKFVGAQIRSRIYPVNAADIIKVPVNLPALPDQASGSEEEDEETLQVVGEEPDILSGEDDDEESLSSEEDDVFVEEAVEHHMQNSPATAGPRRSTRNRRPPSHLQDYVVENH